MGYAAKGEMCTTNGKRPTGEEEQQRRRTTGGGKVIYNNMLMQWWTMDDCCTFVRINTTGSEWKEASATARHRTRHNRNRVGQWMMRPVARPRHSTTSSKPKQKNKQGKRENSFAQSTRFLSIAQCRRYHIPSRQPITLIQQQQLKKCSSHGQQQSVNGIVRTDSSTPHVSTFLTLRLFLFSFWILFDQTSKGFNLGLAIWFTDQVMALPDWT